MIRRRTARFLGEETGAALTEMAIVMTIVIMTLAAFVELVFMVFTWNVATKSLQYGSRLASISNPVDPAVTTTLTGGTPGDPVAFGTFTTRTCVGTATAARTMTGTCNGAGFSADQEQAMRRIMFGGDYDGARSCSVPSSSWEQIGMCDILPALFNPGSANPPRIRVTYADGGLGYYDRPNGGVPIITISIEDLAFDLPVLGGLLGLAGITYPAFTISSVGEDLSETRS